MTLVDARALLSIENNSSWCYNLKVSVSDALKSDVLLPHKTLQFSDIDPQCNNVILDIYNVTIMFTFDFTMLP